MISNRGASPDEAMDEARDSREVVEVGRTVLEH